MSKLIDKPMLTPESNIYVAGHRGMVGAAIIRKLESEDFKNILTRTHGELDLTNQQAVRTFFTEQNIDYVVLAAAKVGGIHANNIFPAEFIYQNIMIEANVIHEAYGAGVKNLLFLGSSCIYPKNARQPMKESELLTGALESTNEPYAIAKIAGIKLCESYNRQYGTDYRSVMPTNLYGPNDNFDLSTSHVIPAMMRKIHLAKLAMEGDFKAIQKDERIYGIIPKGLKIHMSSHSSSLNPGHSVPIWGTGNARREFLHVDDMAAACVYVMQLPDVEYTMHTEPMLSHVNVGMGEDLTIRKLAETIKDIVGYEGVLEYDTSKPDGTSRKLLDVSRINKLDWYPRIKFEEGLTETYEWFLQQ